MTKSNVAARCSWMALIAAMAMLALAACVADEPSPVADVKQTPLEVESQRAFPNLTFELPLLLTHAGDGSDRAFVVEQTGRILVFPNRQDVERAEVFLNLRDQVRYLDREFELGLLGLAFHPKYAENGRFYVYYTPQDDPRRSVISRFRVSDDDPNRADPESEEEIFQLRQPYWNHNGGTILFGPDGYLYIGLGDGGAGGDPHDHGQNLETLHGSILRIDVDRKSEDRAYAIPEDNPFVEREGARDEIWAYGIRNIWRMAFDPKTDKLWAADVGQDRWEEINIIQRGGNYGWSLREGMHPFGRGGSGPRDDLIEPIWEYPHEVGKSVTGGFVYRGERLPSLQGKYLYADFVSGQVWALNFDHDSGKVVSNHTIDGPMMPVMSFGEDQHGEAYFLVRTGEVYRFREK